MTKKPAIDMKRILLGLIWVLLLSQTGFSQTIWPGDINNNGTVNEVDLLYWGWAFGSTGPQRMQVGTAWQAFPAPDPWTQNFPNGLNYAYADCNGDGVVDEDDFDDGIAGNFEEVNGPISPDDFSNANPGQIAPQIHLSTNTPVVLPGAIVNIDLNLEASQGVENFYGIALTLKYTPDLLAGDDGPDFDMQEDNWIEADDTYVQEFFFDKNGNGNASLAITRTNQVAIPIQNGAIGSFSIVIQDIILGLDRDTFILEVDSVRLIGDQFQTIPTIRDRIEIIVASDTSNVVVNTSEFPLRKEDDIKLYPNPNSGKVFIESTEFIDEIRVIDQMGRPLPAYTQRVHTQHLKLDTSPLLPGVYWIQMKLQNNFITKKIICLTKN